jgi:hypothetical protein
VNNAVVTLLASRAPRRRKDCGLCHDLMVTDPENRRNAIATLVAGPIGPNASVQQHLSSHLVSIVQNSPVPCVHCSRRMDPLSVGNRVLAVTASVYVVCVDKTISFRSGTRMSSGDVNIFNAFFETITIRIGAKAFECARKFLPCRTVF